MSTKCRLDGQKIKLLILRMCLSEYEACYKAGVSHATLRSAINGAVVTIKTAGKIAKALEVDPVENMISEG